MELQKTMKRDYAERLRNSIDDNIAQYDSDEFFFDNEQTLYVPNVEHPVGLLEQMLNAPDDCAAAKALYEAYQNLSPIQAAQPAFWIYLAHAELFPYVKKRWPDVQKKDNKKQYILDHWFFAQGTIRHALCGLWWLVYLSIDFDATENERYKYTDFLFSDFNMAFVRFGPSKLIRHREACMGILQFLIDSNNSFIAKNSLKDRIYFAVSHINKIGGSKQLVTLNRDFFYNELDKVGYELLNYHIPKAQKSEDE